ncbi:MAG: hypothetical protein ACD_43C00192G0003 [uncultured bacterium]|nr:MAG: hypothetical protein ACD_43C00192G0003 [uncultured bacterium]
MTANSGNQLGAAGSLGGRAKRPNPNLGNDPAALRQAAQHGVTKADLPIIFETKELIVELLTEKLDAAIEAQIAAMEMGVIKTYAVEFIADKIQRELIRKVDKSIDSASLAAAGVIMPKLAKHTGSQTTAQPDWSDFSDNPPPGTPESKTGKKAAASSVAPDILSGLGEGTGEDTQSANQPNQGFNAGGGTFAPDSNDELRPGDYDALQPGRENMPAFDLSKKQKSAYAQQQLDRQLSQAPKKPGAVDENQPTLNETPTDDGNEDEEQQPGMQDLEQLQQDISNQMGQIHGRTAKANVYEKMQHSGVNAKIHTRKMHSKLLKADAAHQKQKNLAAGGSGSVTQTLQRKAMYYMGLKKLQQYGDKIGGKLKENIKTGKFTYFMIALIIGIAKDLLDWLEIIYGDPGITGSIINIFLSVILTVILFGEGTWFKRWIIKKLFGKIIIVMISEFIPVWDYFPTYTIGILLMGYQNYIEIRKQSRALKELENEVKVEIKRASKSGTINERHLAKIQGRLDKLKKMADPDNHEIWRIV